MVRIIAIVIVLLISHSRICAQTLITFLIKDLESRQSLPGATITMKGSALGTLTDQNGIATLSDVPNGIQGFQVSFVGYDKKELQLQVPEQTRDTVLVYLEVELETLDEIVVSATRSSRTIDDLAIRVETITAGELEEKAVMQPGNIKMMLTESTGIQTQQTSATSASTSIRIQGLDAKYTQMLRDGFPLYSGFASGLSILQIPPLDLRRVEVIKGSASTLYGGGAIAGLINLVTKEPAAKRDISILANANQTKALDLSGYYSQKFKKIGLTVYGSRNTQQAFDRNDDGFSDIPEYQRYTVNPRLYYYRNNVTVSLGLNTSFENRIGGDMKVIDGNSDAFHSYFERNKSNRYSTQLKMERRFNDRSILTMKNSVGYFNRKINLANYSFSGNQLASYTEVNHVISTTVNEWIAGINLWTDNFTQGLSANALNYQLNTIGVFLQNNHTFSEKLSIESGLRLDHVSLGKQFLLPRVSILYRFTEKLSSRLGGGLGYKAPTLFSEEAESRSFRNIASLNMTSVKTEKSVGANVDFNYKTQISQEADIAINQLFFYTVVNNPLILSNSTDIDGNYFFLNADGYLRSQGLETNVRLGYKDYSLYLGYTFIDAKRDFSGLSSVNPLTARHRINANILYELEGKLRIAYEVFYIGSQYLTSGEKTRDYWVMGVSAEKTFEKFSLFVNAENFLDSRQSRFEPMYSGTFEQPQFREIYSPIDGFIFNGGFRLKL